MSHRVGSTRMFYGKYEFNPLPVFSQTTELVRDSKKDILSLKNTLDFTGSLLEVLPSESGIFPNMYLQKELLRTALSASGTKEFKITFESKIVQSGIYPRVSNVKFNEGVWVDRIDYTFSMEYDEIAQSGLAIQSFNENWNFDENEDRRSVAATHDISAVGINTAIPPSSNNAYINARTFVMGRIGFSKVPVGHPVFAIGSGSLAGYEEKRTESVDIQGGAFSVTEAFTLSSGNFIHTQNGQLSTDKDGISTVSLQGNIRGLGRGDIAYIRALNGFKNKVKPKFPADASGVYLELEGAATLFTNAPESQSFTKNKFAGTIEYSISYTDNPTQDLPSGVQDFTISVQNEKPVRLFASFPIMERTLGNVVQDIGTSTEGRFTISGSAVGKQGFPFASLVDFVEGKINDLRPLSINYVTLRLEQRSVTKDESKNTVNFSLGWAYTVDLNQVPGADDDIVLD